MFDKKNLIELLKFQNLIGVNLVSDFLPGRESVNLSELVSSRTENKDFSEENNPAYNTIDKKKDIENIEDDRRFSIKEIKEELDNLDKPQEIVLLKRFSTQTVIGDGFEKADILLIGEAPGEEEDTKGIPFCGKSGILLNEALSKIGLSRAKNLYITNTIFWRPLNNRKPEEKEIKFCRSFLDKIIETVDPKIIITSGGVSTLEITESKDAISDLIGKFFEKTINGKRIKIFPIYHPSYLLRSPSSKKVLWKNLLTLKKELIEQNLL